MPPVRGESYSTRHFFRGGRCYRPVIALLFFSVIAPLLVFTGRLHNFGSSFGHKDFIDDSSNIADVQLELLRITRSEQISSGEPQKPSIERQNNQKVISDARVRHMRDQLIRAKVYLNLSPIRNNAHFVRELRQRIKEVQRTLGEANKDTDLPKSAPERMRTMENTLNKGKQIHDDCSSMVKKLRAMVHSTEEQLRVQKKQSTYLTQLAARTLPKGLHCLPMRLTTEYYALTPSEQEFPNKEKLDDPSLYHHAIFSDNILATAVVVNSTVFHAKEPKKHVFHLVTDKLNYAAMRMWFLANPPGNATIGIQNIDEFTWLNSSYCPVLRQLQSASTKEFYFRTHHTSTDEGSSSLKYRNPKYLSMLNHLRFYLPEIFPKLDKVLFLDDDVVVLKDLTTLWAIDLNGKVNGAVETCGETFHRFDKYLNFSNPLITRNFDPNSCGWAYGMNIFDLREWRKQDVTGIYHKWQHLAIMETGQLAAWANHFLQSYRNPKYLSMLNHLRFYLPQVYPKLDKILFLDDDIVVQKDLTPLWSINLHGKVNGAVETCGESFHRFDKYLNFSNPHIARNFDPNACGWAYGMNIFDLEEWRKQGITGMYHRWQKLNKDRLLWKLGTLPPGLITFYNLTYALEKHVLGLGYDPNVDRAEIERAAVIHYNGNMKPWLEIGITKYRQYWTKYVKYDHIFLQQCNISE